MATEGVFAHGTLLKAASVAAPTVFVTVAEVTNINPPSPSIDSIEYTSHDSVDANGNPSKEFGPGNIDAGSMSFDFNFIPDNATHDDSVGGLYGLAMSRAVVPWQVVFPTTPTVTMTVTGFLTAVSVTAPQDGKLGGSATLKLSGGIVFTTGV